MAELTSISALADAIAASGTEYAPIDQDGQTVKITLADLVAGGIETGTNTNGTWMRFPTGHQICWAPPNGTPITTSTSGGSIYYSSFVTWTYPKPFDSAPRVLPGHKYGGSGPIAWIAVGTPLSSSVDVRGVSYANNGSVIFEGVAIGTWS